MVWWVFKRVLLVFVTWLGGIALMLLGLLLVLGGCMGTNSGISILGFVLILGGLFLGMFSKALTKWIEIK
jgi:hypothetical protein